MKRRYIFALLSIAFFHTAEAQWIQTDGPYGKTSVTSLKSHSSTVFSTTACGLFTSDSTNEFWHLLLSGYIKALAFDGDTAYVGFDSGELKKFSPSNPSDATSCNIGRSIGDIEIKNGKIYIATLGGGFLISSDHGETYLQCNDGLPQMNWGHDFILEIYIGSQYIFYRTEVGVYRNSIEPGTWSIIPGPIPGSGDIGMLYCADDTLYVSRGKNLFRSTDNGNSWTDIFTASSLITCMISEGQNLYLGTNADGVFYSPDLGTQWTPLATGFPEDNTTSLLKTESSFYCGTSNSGVLVYSNSGWNQFRQGMICSSPTSIAIIPDAVVASDLYAVYERKDGNSWKAIGPVIDRSYLGPVISSGDTLFVTAKQVNPLYPFFQGWVLFSNDHGVNWQTTVTPVPYVREYQYNIYINNGDLYVYEAEMLSVTDNIGQSWRQSSIPSQFCNCIYYLLVHNDVPFVVACGDGQLLRMENDQWILSNSGLPQNHGIARIAACKDAIFAHVYGSGMFMSSNDGIFWSLRTNGFPIDYWGYMSYAFQGNSLFVSTSKGLFYTTDLGGNWHNFNENLPNIDILSLGIKNDTLFAGTNGNGVWKTALASIPLDMPEASSFESGLDVFPNPTTGLIRLNASFDNAACYQLYDLWGRCRMNGYLNNQPELNLSGLEEGIYQLRVVSGQHKMSSRILLQH